MKRHNIYHKILQIGVVSLLFLGIFSSCVKSRVGRTDFSSLQPIVLIPEGGLHTFSNEALTFPGTDSTDTATFHVNYAATNVAPTDETITIGVDQAALSTFNSTSTAQYAIFPDSIFSFNTTTVVVKKGDNYSKAISLAVFPYKIDPTKNYMLPISIKTVPAGSTISTNFGTIYYHLIGNPLAGAYFWDFTRFNANDSTGANSGHFAGASTIFAPDDATTIEVPTGYFTQPRYVLTFDNNGGVLSNFQVSFNAGDIATMHSNGVDVAQSPVIIVADGVNKIFEFQWKATVLSSGAPRYVIDRFYK